ncbi:MAG: hypothetical protein MI922_04675, partial [Bacteroidales bacterium]|nr:hypothetical protein [Bacteroidales bacterium]
MKMINCARENLIRLIVFLPLFFNVGEVFTASIKLYYDANIPQIEFAAGDVQKSLAYNEEELQHYSINDYKDVKEDLSIIIATKKQVSTLKSNHVKKIQLESLTGSQSYLISTINSNGKTIWVVGVDANGAMYGGLQLAEYIKLRGVEGEFNEQASPYIARRGIKLNIPLDARVPSYDDDGDAAHMNIRHMWDMDFWYNYFDILARNRYNVMTFWNCHPFNAMCKVPGYPETAVEDVYDYNGLVKKMTIDEKIEFWTEVFDYATNRGFEIFWFNWNVFAYGAVGKYGIEDNPRNDEVKTYSRAA